MIVSRRDVDSEHVVGVVLMEQMQREVENTKLWT
jgi:hypothetical protein